MFSITPSIKIVATILAKNEDDIIADMIEHHLSQGVSQIIFTDNSSTDNTRQIAEKYPEVIEIIDEPDDTHNQSKWVSRMAKLACKLNPDWIIHLDADELWYNLTQLKYIQGNIAACEGVYLHPPVKNFSLYNMRFYLDFDHLPISQEVKIAHRPDPDIIITHGNHGVIGKPFINTKKIHRHHYPIRSSDQWKRKAQGHLSLMKRNAPCARWQKWHEHNDINAEYIKMADAWQSYQQTLDKLSFLSLMANWATQDMIYFFENHPNFLPHIGELEARNKD